MLAYQWVVRRTRCVRGSTLPANGHAIAIMAAPITEQMAAKFKKGVAKAVYRMTRCCRLYGERSRDSHALKRGQQQRLVIPHSGVPSGAPQNRLPTRPLTYSTKLGDRFRSAKSASFTSVAMESPVVIGGATN